ncbi:MAG: SUMF1/EgtB/PvdO family nonheme iron enzyme, partial [Verrucomicrobia bacterium]|nr:SUMF1/EgtB/PvdO family nonheme iron enzyme [Verrucomicrobiota bacterium]
FEWCLDWYSGLYPTEATDPVETFGTDRVLRSGSWVDYAYYCRSAFRHNHLPPTRHSFQIGFRVALTPVK